MSMKQFIAADTKKNIKNLIDKLSGNTIENAINYLTLTVNAEREGMGDKSIYRYNFKINGMRCSVMFFNYEGKAGNFSFNVEPVTI